MRKQIAEMLNKRFKFGKLFLEIFNFQVCQAFKLHVHNGLCLNVVKLEPLYKPVLRVFRITASADDSYHFVDIVDCNNEGFQNVCARKSLVQLELCPARDHFVTVLNKVLDKLLKCQYFRAALDKREIYDSEVRLQCCLCKQLI